MTAVLCVNEFLSNRNNQLSHGSSTVAETERGVSGEKYI